MGNRLFLLRILVRAAYFIPQPYILYTYYILRYTYYGEFLRVLLVRQLVLLVRYAVSYVSPYILQVIRQIYGWIFNIIGYFYGDNRGFFMFGLLIYYIDTYILTDYYLGN